MKVKIELVDLNNFKKVASDYTAREVEMAMPQVLTEEASIIFRESQKIVPVKTGILRASGTIMPPTKKGRKWQVTIGYGGAASSYALAQHENLQYRHQEGKSAKYLEIPTQQRREKMPDAIRNRLKRIIGR
jgi:1-acyl-sn-glycerol-3-phosphate acyltransferase